MSSQASSNPCDDQPERKKFYVNFNQDKTAICCGSTAGWKIIDLNQDDDVNTVYKVSEEEVYIIEKLFASALVAVVTVDAPRMLKVRHYKKGTEICNYTYASSILNVKMNRSRLCVILRDSCHIHDIHTMTVLHTIGETPPNNNGLCALSWGDSINLLAYPSSITSGYVQIFDTSNLVSRITIKAHESPLVAMAFNPQGTLLATASIKGTLIRVHNVVDGTRVAAFRRGISRCVNIHSLTFSPCGSLVGVCSNTETVHIYKIPENIVRAASEQTWMAYFSTYLPTRLADTLDTERDFAITHLPVTEEMKKVIGMKEKNGYLRLLVATEDGFLYVYSIDQETGALSLKKKIDYDNVPLTNDSSDASSCAAPSEGSTLLGSYAGIVKGNSPGQMSESDKLRVVQEATAAPPEDTFLNYEEEYPPLTLD